MRPLALAVAVALAGCTAHAGATIGIQATGKITYGWQAGAGTLGEVIVGQSVANGRTLTFAALHGWYPVRIDHDEPDDHVPYVGRIETQPGLMLGVATDHESVHGVAGIDTRELFATGDDGADLRGLALTAGIRLIGGEAELYLAAEAMLVGYPTGD